VDGRRYNAYECVLLRPWPNAEPWVARIEEILARINNRNKVQTWLGVRWFYRRRDLLPSGMSEFPPCEDTEHEVYMSSSKLDEVAADTVLESCRVLSASEVPDLAAFMQNEAGENTFFYRYEYNPFTRDKTVPLFALPGGRPAPRNAAAAPAAESKRKPKQPRASASEAPAAGTSGRVGASHCRAATAAAASVACAAATERASAEVRPAAAARTAGHAESSTSTGQQEPSTTAALEASAAALVTSLSAPRPAHGSTSREEAASGSDTPPGEEAGRRESREESRLEALQKKLDRTWPPFTDVNGVFRHELKAIIPAAGERYAGESCARCEIPGAPHLATTTSHATMRCTPPCPPARIRDSPPTLPGLSRVACVCGAAAGCDRAGLVFHTKNLMTHAAPRNGQPAKLASSRSHTAALVALLGYVPAALEPGVKREPGAKPAPADAYSSMSSIAPLKPNSAERTVKPSKSESRPAPVPKNHESRNFGGHDARHINYRGMKLAFSNAQVLLVRRERLGTNPARNVKFLGNLQGPPSDWQGELAAAKERAQQAGLVLVLARQYDELHLTRPGGLDSNHCLHLFNHFRPAEKKMINKWETYMPIALHRTYERLVRQPLHMSAGRLDALQFDGLFDKLREREIQQTSISPAEEKTQRSLLLVTRTWVSETTLQPGEAVVARFQDGHDWFTGVVESIGADGAGADGSVSVAYDDGDFEADVPAPGGRTSRPLVRLPRARWPWAVLPSGWWLRDTPFAGGVEVPAGRPSAGAAPLAWLPCTSAVISGSHAPVITCRCVAAC
jgi:hypothetical protein